MNTFIHKYKILITGFQPFGGYENNPSEELVHFVNLHHKQFEDCLIKGVVLPVAYFESWEILNQNINAFKPDIVISFGYAPDTNGMRIESIARNYDGGSSDNSGKSHCGEIISDGTLRCNSTLAIEEINKALIKNGFSSFISDDAGEYICNHIFYNLMNYSRSYPEMKAGFIHIPSWTVEGKKGLFEALKIIIKVGVYGEIMI
jgi:pyroglutamyl-peptidase